MKKTKALKNIIEKMDKESGYVWMRGGPNWQLREDFNYKAITGVKTVFEALHLTELLCAEGFKIDDTALPVNKKDNLFAEE